MTFLNAPVGLFRLIFKTALKPTSLIVVALFLASCGEEKVRSETEYADVATEAHAAGESRLAILELAAGIRNFPRSTELQVLRGKIFLDLEDGSAAEIAFNKAIALGYNRQFLKHDLAESWLYQRNPSKVIDHLEKEIKQGSKDPLIYEVIGRAYLVLRDRSNPTLFMKNMNKAEEYIEEAYRINPKSTRVLISKAWLAALMGEIDEALDWLEKADSIVKDQRQNLAVMAELLVMQDKVDQAQELYTRLVKKFPQYPQYKVELGYTYLLNDDYVKSREWIEPVAKRYPNQLRAINLLANLALMEKKYEEAKELSEAVLVKMPEDLKAIMVNGASSYFLNDFENAHQKLSHFYNKTGSVSALKLLAATKLKLNENAEAAKLLENAGQATKNQSDVELLNLVAISSAKIGQTDIALEAYKQLAEQQPDTASYQKNTALIQISQGNYEEGFNNLEKALYDGQAETDPGQNLYMLTNKALQTRQYDRAAGYIKRYKKIAPDDYKPWIMSAVLQSMLKNNAAVRQDFDQAMKIAPDVAEVRARYAIFEKIQGNQDKALELATTALQLNPSDVGAGKLIIDDLVKHKKFDEIKTIVDNAVNNDKASEASKLIFADYYTLLGRPQETLKILRKLSSALKETASYQIISGKAYLRNGQADRAVDVLEKFSVRHPNNIQALKQLLRGYLLTGNQRKYQSTLEKIDQLAPSDYGNQIELAKLYIATGKYDRAKKTLSTMNPADEQQAFQKNIIHAAMETNRKNYKKALEILSPLSEQYPSNGAVSMLYARNLASDGQVGKAIQVSRAWAGQHPNNIDVKQFIGDLYLRESDNENARLQYESILASGDRVKRRAEIHAHNNLANIYMEDKQGQKAMEHAQKAYDLAPNNPAVVDTFAQVLMLEGQAEEAVNHFNQAITLLPRDDRSNRSLFTLSKAKALVQIGQKEKAQRILSRLVKDDPEFSRMDEVKRLLSEL